jgi:hypothetical protein
LDSGFDFELWYNSYDPNFVEITKGSRLPERWMNYGEVLEKYKDSIIKPINPYVDYMCPPPRLVSIVNNTVTLQQANYAEIYLSIRKTGFYNVDKVWLRQYYQSKDDWETPQDCFGGNYKVFTPWVIDADVEARIHQADNSPFSVVETQHEFKKIPDSTIYYDPGFIGINFKNVGDHMKTDNLGKIEKHSPLYNITFTADDTIVERVRKFYEEK